MTEEKHEIITRLKWLLRRTRAGEDIRFLTLNEDQTIVTIEFKNGYHRKVSIEGDSGIAIIQDVTKALY